MPKKIRRVEPKAKTTIYLTKEAIKQLNEICAIKIRNNAGYCKSDTVCEAIKDLHDRYRE